MSRRRMAALAALALCALVAGCGTTHVIPRLGRQPNSRATAAAKRFLKRYVTNDGRVVRVDQGGDTVGEGQAYGMLMAAAIGDSKRFDAIWGWTQAHLRRPDGLISFLWRNGRVVDPQAATDADLDASRALLVAACQFKHPAYRQQALALGKAILDVETTSGGTPVITAGPWAVNPPVTIDPSYFSPATYAALGTASRDSRWSQVTLSSRAIVNELMRAPHVLPPDWARMENGKPVPIGTPSNPGQTPQFGFDAVRTLVRYAEDPDPAGRAIAARAWPVFAHEPATNVPVNRTLTGKPLGDVLHPVGLVAAAGAASAAGETSARDGLLDQAESLDRHSPTYYGSAWVALGRMMLTTRMLDPDCS
jgi:endoglucanase